RLTRFLSNEQDAIDDAIDNMQAEGSTIIPTGLLWAWRMLHPDWKGGWGEPDMPRDADPEVLTKVIVLLTDGENAPSSNIGVLSGNSERYFSFGLDYDAQKCDNSRRRDGDCDTAA